MRFLSFHTICSHMWPLDGCSISAFRLWLTTVMCVVKSSCIVCWTSTLVCNPRVSHQSTLQQTGSENPREEEFQVQMQLWVNQVKSLCLGFLTHLTGTMAFPPPKAVRRLTGSVMMRSAIIILFFHLHFYTVIYPPSVYTLRSSNTCSQAVDVLSIFF